VRLDIMCELISRGAARDSLSFFFESDSQIREMQVKQSSEDAARTIGGEVVVVPEARANAK